MSGLLPLALALGGGALGLGLAGLIFARSVREVPSGSALIIQSLRGAGEVRFTRSFALALLNSAELLDISTKVIVIERDRGRSLRCRDGLRLTLRATFSVRVNATAEDVLRVRQRLSPASLASADFLRELFGEKFHEALETLAAMLDHDALICEQERAREQVLEIIGKDLDGFCVEDLSLSALELVPLAELDPDDPLDAKGIRKLTELTSTHKLRIAEANNELERHIAKLEFETSEVLLELERMKRELALRYKEQTGLNVDLDQLRERLDARIRDLAALASGTIER